MHHHYVNVLVVLLYQLRYSFSLFPRETESREVKVLNGLWNFRVDNSSSRDVGFTNEWFKKSLKKVSVAYIVFLCFFLLLHKPFHFNE